jgi:glycosyltransferase involved in cell wall biosynthesis
MNAEKFTSISPIISIITATFNAAKDLPRLIESLHSQTNKNFEWVVADGASNDETLVLLKQVKGFDVIVDSRCDFGIYDAMNRAIKLSSGMYYLVVGADDFLYENAIDDYAKSVKNNKYDVVCGGVRFNNIIRSGIHVKRKWLGASHVVTAHSVGMLIKKTLHEKVGLYSNQYPQCADGLFIKKIFNLKELEYYELDNLVGEFSTNGTSNSNTLRGLCEGFMIQVETERRVLPQMILFWLRVFKNYKRIAREISKL